jgi:hypothetical protein
MAGWVRISRTSWLRASVLCILAGMSVGSVHFAWGKITDPVAVKPGGSPRQSDPTTFLAALQPSGEESFTPDALIAKPLFAPSRRAAVESEPASEPVETLPAAPPEVPPPSYIIDGVIVSADVRKILLRRAPREAGQWVSQGEKTREGWTIVSIRAEAAVLQQGGREYALPLRLRRQSQ